MFITEREYQKAMRRGFIVERGPALDLVHNAFHPRQAWNNQREIDAMSMDVEYVRGLVNRGFLNRHAQEKLEEIKSRGGANLIQAIREGRI